jgi:atypical dual specificity phosphatase
MICGLSGWFRTYGFADVHDRLLVGAYPLDQTDVRMLATMGVDRVLNLAEDGEYRSGERPLVTQAYQEAGIQEYRVPFADFGGLTPDGLELAVREVNGWLDDGLVVYIHCRAGWQRSAAMAAAVIAVREDLDIDGALAWVQKRKPSADPLPHQRDDLQRWWKARGAPEPR